MYVAVPRITGSEAHHAGPGGRGLSGAAGDRERGRVADGQPEMGQDPLLGTHVGVRPRAAQSPPTASRTRSPCSQPDPADSHDQL